MKAILDSSVFFSDYPIAGELYTTPSVSDELIDIRSKGVFEKFCAAGLHIVSPSIQSRAKVTGAAEKTRDTNVISDTDCDLLAVALDLNAVLYTDDFAIQNVAVSPWDTDNSYQPAKGKTHSLEISVQWLWQVFRP